jgi:hypothetical protein
MCLRLKKPVRVAFEFNQAKKNVAAKAATKVQVDKSRKK